MRAGAKAACLHPQDRQHFPELPADTDGRLVKEAKLEVSRVCLETVCHGNIAAKVIALQRIPLHIMPFNRADGARPGYVTGDAQLLPFLITGTFALFRQGLRFRIRDFIVCNHNTAAAASVFCIQQVDSVKRCARTGKEVNDKGVGLVGDEETNGIMNSINRFWERESLFSYYAC